MTRSLMLVAGLGFAFASSALAQDRPMPADDPALIEVAPGSAVQPLGTSGLLAFGPEGIRMPRQDFDEGLDIEPDIVTGSVTRGPYR